jgi:hypothetical protein
MKNRKLASVMVVVVLAVVSLAIQIPAAPAAECGVIASGSGAGYWVSPTFDFKAGDTILLEWSAAGGTDVDLALLNEGEIAADLPLSGSFEYTFAADSTTYVDFDLDDGSDPRPTDMISGTVTLVCGEEEESAPGCASFVNVPAQAVVGTFNWNSELYWMPGEPVSPVKSMEAGQSLWVAGQDESEMYYKVNLACDWYWVRKETMGPNYDDVWNGAPLPQDIVE